MQHSSPDQQVVSLRRRRQPEFGIDVSERAVSELRKLGVGGAQFLRITTVPGGCSGTTYDAAIDDAQSDADIVLFEHEDVRLVTDRAHALWLQGLKVDYSDDLIKAGFKLSNPNATSSCGCGSSFTG